LGSIRIIFLYVHRIRPYDAGVSHLIISRSVDWSFPSDHATATFAIAASFLLHGIRKRALGFLAGALLVCTPRVYVGTHYVTDVLGGVVTGIIAAAAVHSLYREGTRAVASSPKSCRLGKSKNLVGTISRAHDDGVSQRRG
jgi:undecaprenyl-diphosphatase